MELVLLLATDSGLSAPFCAHEHVLPLLFLGSGTHPSHRLFMLTANQTQPFFLASLVFSLFSSYLSDAQFLCNDEDGKCVAGQSGALLPWLQPAVG